MKPRNEISTDELMYRQMMMEQWRIKPSQKAVLILEERITEVLKKLGVDTTQSSESIKFQMEFLDIHLNSISEEDMPNAGGLYIAAKVKGELVPYATIVPAKMEKGGYTFSIMYWQDNKLDEGRVERI